MKIRLYLLFLCLALSPAAFGSPPVPVPVSPVNGATDQPPVVALQVAGISAVAPTLFWQVSTDSLFMPPTWNRGTSKGYVCKTDSLQPATTYFWRVRARKTVWTWYIWPTYSYSAWSKAWKFSTLNPRSVSIWIQMPCRPDHIIPGSDDFEWTLAQMDALAPLVDGFVMPTPFYGGTWGCDKGERPWLVQDYRAVHAKADALNKRIKPIISKSFGNPMSMDPLDWGYDEIKVLRKSPINVCPLLGADAAGVMSTLPDKRKFIRFQLPPGGEDRHYTMQLTTSGNTYVRLYQVPYGKSKFVQFNVNGSQTVHFSLPNVWDWCVMLIRDGDDPVRYSIDSFEESPPQPGSFRPLTDGVYAWFGNSMAFETAREHALYDEASRVRFDYLYKWYYDSIAAPYKTFDGFCDYANEPHYFDQQSIDRLPDFQRHLAQKQFAYTKKPEMFWFDTYDTLRNGQAEGAYANDMRQGGFSKSWAKWDGTEPVEWTIYPDWEIYLSEVMQCMDKGNWIVYAQVPCFEDTLGLKMTTKWLEIWRQLPLSYQTRFRWLIYTEFREQIAEAKEVARAIRAGMK